MGGCLLSIIAMSKGAFKTIVLCLNIVFSSAKNMKSDIRNPLLLLLKKTVLKINRKKRRLILDDTKMKSLFRYNTKSIAILPDK